MWMVETNFILKNTLLPNENKSSQAPRDKNCILLYSANCTRPKIASAVYCEVCVQWLHSLVLQRCRYKAGCRPAQDNYCSYCSILWGGGHKKLMDGTLMIQIPWHYAVDSSTSICIVHGQYFPAWEEESPMKLNGIYDACVITKVQSPSSRWVVPVIKRYASVWNIERRAAVKASVNRMAESNESRPQPWWIQATCGDLTVDRTTATLQCVDTLRNKDM